MKKLGFRYSHLSAAFVVAAFAATACSDDSTNSVSPVATTVSVNVGSNGMTGTVGQALAQAVSVHVADQNGNALQNVSVGWTVVSGGGTVDSPSTTTNSTGDATVHWTLGSAAGMDSLRASIANGSSVIVTATGTSAAAAQLAVVSGDGQSVTAGTVTQPLIVKVTDQFGNPVANSTVNWAVAGGGALSASTSTSDANGLAQVTLTTDPTAATYAVTATGAAGTPVTFTITGM